MFLVTVQQFLSGREKRLMPVIRAANLPKKIRQVAPLGKPGKLRDVVQANVEKPLDTGVRQSSEKVGGGALRKTD